MSRSDKSNGWSAGAFSPEPLDSLQQIHGVGGALVGAHLGEGVDRRCLEVLADPVGVAKRFGSYRLSGTFVGTVLGQMQNPRDACGSAGVFCSPDRHSA
jgi:hypothetical protein